MTTNTLGSLNIPMKIEGLCFLNTFFLLPRQEGNEECVLCLLGECEESKGPGSLSMQEALDSVLNTQIKQGRGMGEGVSIWFLFRLSACPIPAPLTTCIIRK